MGMSSLSTEVRREMLNSTYPALYVVMFAIMEVRMMIMMMMIMMIQGNTRERTWVDQQMKPLHVTKENHRALDTITRHLQHVAPVSLKDMERYTSPWAVSAEDEDKFE